MKPTLSLILLILLTGCTTIKGEGGKFRLYEEAHKDGTKSAVQLGKGGLVWKSTF